MQKQTISKEQLFGNPDFHGLSQNKDFLEDSVREVIILPILKELGYNADNIVRSKKLVHPFIKAGSKKRPVNLVPDYALKVENNFAWILDAKAMKYFILLVFSTIITVSGYTQTYISIVPCLTNDAGTLAEKSNFSFEIGRQWDVFSLGVDAGKTSLGKVRGRDTTAYLEIRPNLNVFQQGKFTNTFTAGIGFIFNSKQSLMTELTSGIEYAFNTKVHFNVYFGQYYYSGRRDASSVTFFGLSAMLYFLPSIHTSLIKPKAA